MSVRRRPLPVWYADDALDDLDGIADYLATAGEWQAAMDIPDRIRAVIPLLGHQPRAWPVGASGYRERVLAELPFRIVYLVEPQRVVVLRIKHTRQQWPE